MKSLSEIKQQKEKKKKKQSLLCCVKDMQRIRETQRAYITYCKDDVLLGGCVRKEAGFEGKSPEEDQHRHHKP